MFSEPCNRPRVRSEIVHVLFSPLDSVGSIQNISHTEIDATITSSAVFVK